MRHIKPIKKNQDFKMVCMKFDAELISLIDREVNKLKITRTQWIHDAAQEKLSGEK